MKYEITVQETQAIAIGAGILGTGGGGNTYLGRIRLNQEIKQHKAPCQVIGAEDVPDDAWVCAVSTMGAPTVGIEKLPRGTEIRDTVRALEQHLGQPFAALIIGEIGGSNALNPLIAGIQLAFDGLAHIHQPDTAGHGVEYDQHSLAHYGASIQIRVLESVSSAIRSGRRLLPAPGASRLPALRGRSTS